MAITPLPVSANLENLRKRAKTLLKAAHAADPAALDQVGPYFGNPGDITLQQAQLVIARGHGFSSWTRLKRHVEGAGDEAGDQIANRFLDLVTLAYGQVPDFGPKRFEQAAELLAEHPEIRTENIYCAAAIGDVDQIDRWLEADPGLTDRKGGFFNWEPLMYAAYARLPGHSTLQAGLRLLEHEADPNAYYMWGGQYKFTALTGVFGQGEGGPVNLPEHPDYVAFARALLERGANPNDSQAAYNRFFEPDNTCLELLLEFGLTARDKNNWLLVEDDRLMPHPSETMHYQLIQSIKRGYAARIRLLLAHGVDLEKPDETYEGRTNGRTPYQVALLMGEQEIAEMLTEAGAEAKPLAPEDAFQVACLAGDLEAARAMLNATPDLASRVMQVDMLRDAVSRNNRAGLAAMIALGFDVNQRRGATALHDAAWAGNIEFAQMLLEAGADPTLRDENYWASPLGFALHAEQADMVAFLEQCEMDIFTAATRGNLKQITKRLAEDAARVNQLFAQVRPGARPSPSDQATPLVYAVLSDQAGAARILLENGADPKVKDAKGVPLMQLARDTAGAETCAVLKDYLNRR